MRATMLENILPHVALWGLGFALWNLIIITEKHLRDLNKALYSKAIVIAFAAGLFAYAVTIGVMATLA